MLKKVLIVVVVLIAGFLAFVAMRPSTYHVERSATVAAPADVVFAELNSFENFTKWSPWEKLDPALKRTYAGPKEGVGASYSWIGNDKVGEGKMTIEESKAPRVVKAKIEFIKPYASTPVATWSLAPEGDKTKVTWAMDGENNFGGKLAGVFMDFDTMIGKDFEEGLKNLDGVAQTDAKAKAAAVPPADAAAATPPGDAPPAPGAPPATPPAKGKAG